jgi:hypothetical protein
VVVEVQPFKRPSSERNTRPLSMDIELARMTKEIQA